MPQAPSPCGSWWRRRFSRNNLMPATFTPEAMMNSGGLGPSILNALGGLGSVAGAALTGSNIAGYNGALSNAGRNSVLQPWQINNNGVNAGWQGNQITTNLGPSLSGAGTGLQWLALAGTNAAGQYMNGG